MSEQAAPSRIAEQTAQSGALAMLLVFSLALAIAPLSAYFGTQWYITPDNSIYPAAAAVITANIILFSYIFVAIREDAAHQKAADVKKNQ